MQALDVVAIIVGIIGTVIGGVVGIGQLVTMRRVKNEKIDHIVTDLLEALKQHQVGIHIPGLSEKAGMQVAMSIKKVLMRHF